MRIAAPRGSNDSAWLALRSALWPDVPEAAHRCEMAAVLSGGGYVRLALSASEAAVGFVEASRRVEHVTGTSTSPVAFIEGLYVVPASRRRGIARALVDSVLEWAVAAGCAELASDSLLENTDAHVMHRALGFEETERVVYFRRALHDH